MDTSLKLGIPDDEAATAPGRRFQLTEKRANLISRFLVPFALAAWAVLANKLMADEMKRQDNDDATGAPAGAIEEEEDAPLDSTANDDDAAPLDAATSGESNVVRLADHKAWNNPVGSPENFAFHRTEQPLELRSSIADGSSSGLADGLAATEGGSYVATMPKLASVDGEAAPLGAANRRAQSEEATANRRPVVSSSVNLGTARPNEAMVLTAAMLLSGASDADGDSLFVEALEADKGAITALGEGMWLYTPDEGYDGPVALSYAISDGEISVPQTAGVEFVATLDGGISGSDDDDVQAATPDDDAFDGAAGNDMLYGREGSDIITGGEGDDRLIGGDGDDIIYGGAGDDHLFGRDGSDILIAGDGNDYVSGGAGDDVLLGDAGDDIILGDAGDDILLGGAGSDVVSGGTGDDRIVIGAADEGHDVVNGDAGIDTLDFSAIATGVTVDLAAGTYATETGTGEVSEVENVVASAGADVIVADGQANVLTGGAGEDSFVFEDVASLTNAGGAHDRITDFEVGDRIDFSAMNAAFGLAGSLHLHFAGQGLYTDLGSLSYWYGQGEDASDRTVIRGRYKYEQEDSEDDYFMLDLDGHHELTSFDFILEQNENGL